jgi:hypothetical protein
MIDTVRHARAGVEAPSRLATAPVPADIRRAVVILASSRGCSSLLFHLLRATGAFVSLDGEHTYLYKLYGMGLPESPAAHDGNVDQNADTDGFVNALLDDCAVPATDGAHPQPETYAGQVTRRLIGQWPWLAHDTAGVRELAQDRIERRGRGTGPFDHEGYFLDLLAELRRQGAPVDPRYYDLTPGVTAHRFAMRRPASGPPPGLPGTIEEPPFVVPVPATPATADHLRSRPLLLKASVDAYRSDLVEKLLPGADVRFVHLVRNPAGAVNGLYDGWRDRGFFSHVMSGRATLRITGYSDRPWGSTWWNFDLPPDWPDVVRSPLPEVCAFQWRQAHRSILRSLDRSTAPHLRVHAEDITTGRDRRTAALREIFRFCGVTPDFPAATGPERVIMATAPPRSGRWRERAPLLRRVLDDPAVLDTADRMGYGTVPDSRWT